MSSFTINTPPPPPFVVLFGLALLWAYGVTDPAWQTDDPEWEGRQFDAPFNPRAPRINPIAVSTPQIIAWLEAKAPRAIGDWNSIGAEEYARSFVAAQTAGSDVIADLYQGLLTTFQQGGTRSDFADLVTPILRQKGWLTDDPDELGARVNLIYDTNVRIAQATGDWNNYVANEPLIPYLYWSAVGDARTRHSHQACNGLLLPVSHPFYQRYGVPAGYRCRCNLIPMSRSQAARKGNISTEADVARAEAAIAEDPTFWRYNVGRSALQSQADAVDQANARRMPGSSPVDVNQAAARGAAVWAALLGQGVQALIANLGSTNTNN